MNIFRRISCLLKITKCDLSLVEIYPMDLIQHKTKRIFRCSSEKTPCSIRIFRKFFSKIRLVDEDRKSKEEKSIIEIDGNPPKRFEIYQIQSTSIEISVAVCVLRANKKWVSGLAAGYLNKYSAHYISTSLYVCIIRV